MSVAKTRLYNFQNDRAAKIPISSVKIDAELDAVLAAINQKVQIKSTAPTSPVDGQTWIDISQDPPVMKIYDQTNAGWTEATVFGGFDAYSEKTSLVGDDLFVINDSEDSDSLKRLKLSTILDAIYPIGFVVTLGVSTNPATLFGIGTWTAIAGKVIVGIDAGQTEFDTLDETGGEKTHTLTVNEMPSHTHQGSFGTDDMNFNNTAAFMTADTTQYHTATNNTGGGSAHNNLQPYIVKYVWQRTA